MEAGAGLAARKMTMFRSEDAEWLFDLALEFALAEAALERAANAALQDVDLTRDTNPDASLHWAALRSAVRLVHDEADRYWAKFCGRSSRSSAFQGSIANPLETIP